MNDANNYEHVHDGIVDALGESFRWDDIDEAESVVANVRRLVADRDRLLDATKPPA